MSKKRDMARLDAAAMGEAIENTDSNLYGLIDGEVLSDKEKKHWLLLRLVFEWFLPSESRSIYRGFPVLQSSS